MKPVVRPVRVDDERTSVERATNCHEPALRPGAAIDVEIDGRWVRCEVVGTEFTVLIVKRL